MPRYIDADALVDFANNHKDKTIDSNDIARFPTADVKKVVHGYWKRRGYLDQCCSVCGETPDREQGETPPEYDICPYCGALMDGPEAEETLSHEKG
jgi:hypothetical protein